MAEANTGAEPTGAKPDRGTAASGSRTAAGVVDYSAPPGPQDEDLEGDPAATAAGGVGTAATTGNVVAYSVPPGPKDEDVDDDPAATAAGGAATSGKVVAYSVPPGPKDEDVEEGPAANPPDPD